MIIVGSTVTFWSWSDKGEEVEITGVVQSEFREPPEEDALERLNYSVRAQDGSVHTPYAHECTEVSCDCCEETSVGLNIMFICPKCQAEDERDYNERVGVTYRDDTPCLDTSFHDHEMRC